MHDALDLTLSVMEGFDCPRALTVAILLRYGEFAQVAKLRADPTLYSGYYSYYSAACATGFLKKCKTLPTGIDKRSAALEKWWGGERDCYQTNLRLTGLFTGGSRTPEEARIVEFINTVRKKVYSLIGSGPPDDLEGRFGPGATVSDNSRLCLVPDKMSSIPTLTSSAQLIIPAWEQTWWAKARAALGWDPPVEVKGNHYFTVPKDSTTERSCGKEPSLNVFYQLALGRAMRKRLLSRGFDLKRGKDTHMQVACEASQTWKGTPYKYLRGHGLATLDLSNASDTIARVLVKLVFPHKWASALEALRSPYTKVDGKWVLLEKFSSMGNGFTFELETTLFAALCMAIDETLVPGTDLFVFGDDIILPEKHCRTVQAVFAYFGFTLNSEKSFGKNFGSPSTLFKELKEGPFRESCGGDFFDGWAVRPYHLEEFPSEPQHYIALANGLRRLTRRDGEAWRLFPGLLRAWHRTLDNVPVQCRVCRGPEDLGDIVITDDESRWKTRWRSGIRYLRVYRPARHTRVSWEHWKPEIQNAAIIYGVARGPNLPYGQDWTTVTERDYYLVPRDSVMGYKVGWTPYS